MRPIRNLLAMLASLAGSTTLAFLFFAIFQYAQRAETSTTGLVIPSYVVMTGIAAIGLAILYFLTDFALKEKITAKSNPLND